jgi:hypothetical protein
MAPYNEEEVEDFFAPLMENSISKVSFLVVSIVITIPFSLACYGIVCFIKHSSMAKPTLINRFIASACITGLQYILLVQASF